MDFSQPNKINSCAPERVSNRNDFFHGNSQNFRSQNPNLMPPRSYQKPTCAYQSNNINKSNINNPGNNSYMPHTCTTIMPQPQMSNTTQMNNTAQMNNIAQMSTPTQMNNMPQLGSFNPNRMYNPRIQTMSMKANNSYEPCAYKTAENCWPMTTDSMPCSQQLTYTDSDMMESTQRAYYDPPVMEEPTNLDDLKVEYFTVPPPTATETTLIRTPIAMRNPYHSVMEKVAKCREGTTRYYPREPVGDSSNNQTYFYSYKVDEGAKKIPLPNEQCFKSFTKILPIPNGVKIITEIKKEDNVDEGAGDDVINDNKWINKQIEVTLEDANDASASDEEKNNDSSEYFEEDKEN